MPALLVTIDVPESVGQGAVETVLRACSQAYAPGDCEADPGTPSDAPRAHISWLSFDRLEIQIGLSRWNRDRWIRRQLEFADADEPEERYRAVGFAVGSLAGTVVAVRQNEVESGPEPEKPEPQAESDEPEPHPVSRPEPVVVSAPELTASAGVSPTSRPLVLVGAGQVGTAAGTASLGGRVGLEKGFGDFWVLGLEFESRVSIGADPLTVSFYSPRVALGFEVRGEWLALQVALTGGAEVLYVAAVSDTREADGADFVNPVGGLRPRLELGADWRVAPVIGGELSLAGRQYDFDVENERVGSVEILRLVAFVGARIRL